MSNKTYTRQEIIDKLLEITRSNIQVPDSFNSQSDLAAAGLDSLAMVRVLVAIEAEFGVWLEGADLSPTHMKNIDTVADRLTAALEAAAAESASS